MLLRIHTELWQIALLLLLISNCHLCIFSNHILLSVTACSFRSISFRLVYVCELLFSVRCLLLDWCACLHVCSFCANCKIMNNSLKIIKPKKWEHRKNKEGATNKDKMRNRKKQWCKKIISKYVVWIDKLKRKKSRGLVRVIYRPNVARIVWCFLTWLTIFPILLLNFSLSVMFVYWIAHVHVHVQTYTNWSTMKAKHQIFDIVTHKDISWHQP